MTPGQIFLIFVVAFSLELTVSIALTVVNLRHLRSQAHAIPTALKEALDLETYQKSISYSATILRFGVIQVLYSAALLILVLFLNGFELLDEALRPFASAILFIPQSYVLGILYFLVLFLLSFLAKLPFQYYSTFVIEERFGFNKSTVALWITDLLKGLLLTPIFLIPLALMIFWFIDSTGPLWWLFATGGILLFQVVMMFIVPKFILPLFNKFEKLEDDELRKKIDALCRSLEYPVDAVYQVDGSRRSGHSNAYFSGIGKAKRIVLYDTLLEKLSHNQLLAVLAHEVGHKKCGHIVKGILLSTAFTALNLLLLALLLPYEPFYEAFGVQTPSYHVGFVLFGILSGPFSFFLQPLFSHLSRKHEYEADSFAIKAVSNSTDLTTSLVRLAVDNLSNFCPHPLYSWFYYSHPALVERIEAAAKVQH